MCRVETRFLGFGCISYINHMLKKSGIAVRLSRIYLEFVYLMLDQQKNWTFCLAAKWLPHHQYFLSQVAEVFYIESLLEQWE